MFCIHEYVHISNFNKFINQIRTPIIIVSINVYVLFDRQIAHIYIEMGFPGGPRLYAGMGGTLFIKFGYW